MNPDDITMLPIIQDFGVPRVPNGVPPGGARVTLLPPLYIRTLLEYDADFLADRVRAELFMGDTPTGFSNSVAYPQLSIVPLSPLDIMRDLAPDVERALVNHFLNTISSAPRKIDVLRDRVAALEHRLDNTRPKRLRRWIVGHTRATPGRLAAAWDRFWQSFHDLVTFQAWRR